MTVVVRLATTKWDFKEKSFLNKKRSTAFFCCCVVKEKSLDSRLDWVFLHFRKDPCSVSSPHGFENQIGLRPVTEPIYVAIQTTPDISTVRYGPESIRHFPLRLNGTHPFPRPPDEWDHPSLSNRQTDKLAEAPLVEVHPSELTIYHFDRRRETGPVRAGDAILLVGRCPASTREAPASSKGPHPARAPQGTRPAAFFAVTAAADASGTVGALAMQDREAVRAPLSCRWEVLNAGDPSSRSPLAPRHEILLKSHVGQLLVIREPESSPSGGEKREMGQSLAATGTTITSYTKWRLVRAGTPEMPEWAFRNRTPLMTSQTPQSLALTLRRTSRSLPLGSLPLAWQEGLVLEDLLSSLLGCRGTHVRGEELDDAVSENENQIPMWQFSLHNLPAEGGGSAVTDATAPQPSHALSRLVNEASPMISDARRVTRFCEMLAAEGPDAGLIAQALLSAFGAVLKELIAKVASLEAESKGAVLVSGASAGLSIQRAWAKLQRARDSLALLSHLVGKLQKKRGGPLLSALHEAAETVSAGALPAGTFVRFLQRQAAEPEVQMLETWLFEGRIDDPYGEFFITESAEGPRASEAAGGMSRRSRTPGSRSPLSRLDLLLESAEGSIGADGEAGSLDPAESFWSSKFSVVPERVPSFLKDAAQKVLLAGKSVHVLATCNSRAVRGDPFAPALPPAGAGFLLDQMDLRGRLLSLKHFFFVDKADLLGQFLDVAGPVSLLQKRMKGGGVIVTLRSKL
uniref:Spindle pole body component n=1 Tax=Chromera velia CCMP2878 TaxID=1169474 RepID=A0A0K6S929_9ALVE|eukprot:Cvel_28364.t1-p1 / transcript=Cvel_28364.t1 / gene=Cvel_28364 / organism=Chromera_velia_CCMP2878 / gene_product=Gamma-tubulin complex component 2, putative / transcript_product=Gamma-tubulin complex component 2, putative / location=Cvel_scaffold3696:9257-14811(+) / protein_length=743 / sequence_SO=supercontig / SO=protein_coding / is_pseudo=false